MLTKTTREKAPLRQNFRYPNPMLPRWPNRSRLITRAGLVKQQNILNHLLIKSLLPLGFSTNTLGHYTEHRGESLRVTLPISA